MQKLLVIRNGIVTVQNTEKTYTDTVENFLIDGGDVPKRFSNIDCCLDTGSCLIGGYTADIPEYAYDIINRVNDFCDSYDARKAEREEAADVERAERLAKERLDAEQSRWDSLSEEEKLSELLEKKKVERSQAVSRITVEVDGLLFDGDETSQDRMARAVANARAKADMVNAQLKADWMASWGDAESADGIPEEPAYDDYLEYETTWILANNEVRTDIKISQLAQAGTLAGQAQTELWTKPYEA